MCHDSHVGVRGQFYAFYHVGPRNQTLTLRLGNGYLSSLGHPASPSEGFQTPAAKIVRKSF